MRRADSPGKENLILTKIFLAFYFFCSKSTMNCCSVLILWNWMHSL